MITGLLGSIAFLNPWILTGLVFLPVLWFLLRVSPPAPRRMFFPAARFFAGLIPDDRTTTHTPWWILLLRLLVAALLILALARPVLNPVEVLDERGAVRIVMDTGWASAQTWTLQKKEAQSLLDRAARERREIFILETASSPGTNKVRQHGPLTGGQAEAVLRGLVPHPWPSDYAETVKTVLETTEKKQGIISFWLSSGLAEGNPDKLIRTLQNQGSLTLVEPDKNQLPVLLRPHSDRRAGVGKDVQVRISAPDSIGNNIPLSVQTLASDGRVLDIQNVVLSSHTLPLDLTLDIPEGFSNRIGRISLSHRKGAGTVLILDDQSRRKLVGIAGLVDEADTIPLIDSSFYLKRALEPYADIKMGAVQELIDSQPSVIILPDIGAMPLHELNVLESWVREGGLLLRFAGPNMTQGSQFLTPVPLLKSERALEGSMNWGQEVGLAPFPENSPFYGLSVTEEIIIRRQLLAEPVSDLDKKSWAVLEDGTPLVTADALDRGLLVLIHTTATPEWSNLPLSGLYVQMLRRIISLSPDSVLQNQQDGIFYPLLVLDGFGRAVQPDSTVQPVSASEFDSVMPDSWHPPGLYGTSLYQRALNLGENLGRLKTFDAVPGGVVRRFYDGRGETNLMPLVLLAAFMLFLIDWAVMIIMQAGNRIFQPRTLSLAFLTLLMTAGLAQAQTQGDPIRYAGALHLAYVSSPSAAVNRISYSGLEALSVALTRRTSVELAEIVALNPEIDELVFFPFIYWPVTRDTKPLSDKAARKIQHYLDHGGTILFDTRDRPSMPLNMHSFSITDNAAALRRMTASLNIPPLMLMPEDHVLTKSFYLLSDLPGRYEGGGIWVEEKGTSGRDGVSSVIIGSHDWASAWASSGKDSSIRSSWVGGSRQQEMSLRAGINFVMYALTGNYKADQVHLPHILERLGQ